MNAEFIIVQLLDKNVLTALLNTLIIELSHDPDCLRRGVYPQGTGKQVFTEKVCVSVVLSSISIATRWRQLKCPSTEE